MSVALSSVSGRTEQVETVICLRHRTIVVDSLSTQAPPPLQIQRPLVMKADFFVPPNSVYNASRARTHLSDSAVPVSDGTLEQSVMSGAKNTDRGQH